MQKTLMAGILVVFLALAVSCSKSTDPTPPDPTPSPIGDITASDKALLNATNRFGLKLFKNIIDREPVDKNIFISPLSVSFALGMALNGAEGTTEEGIQATLELTGMTMDEINQSYRNSIDILTQLDPMVIFTIANSIWYREGFPIDDAFIMVNQDYFDAAVRELDFSQIWAADTINHWVDINTNGKITEIVSKPIDDYLVMFLINAIYFKGNWTLPFDTNSVVDMPFYFADGSTELKPLMGTDTFFTYGATELFQSVDIPYGDGQFCMTVFLPEPGHTVDDIIGQLNDDTYAAWLAQMTEAEVELWLPKFKFEYEIKLNAVLSSMGMAVAFDEYAADFTDMIDPDAALIGNLYISSVKHKTFVQVDETGTEAAAVTCIGFGATSIIPEKNVMMINRPFVFVIREHETGSILFMAKVADPVWE